MGELKTGKSIHIGAKDNSMSRDTKDDTDKPVGAKGVTNEPVGTKGVTHKPFGATGVTEISNVPSRRTVAKSSSEVAKSARDVIMNDPAASLMTKKLAREESNSVDRGVDNFTMKTGGINKDQKRGKSSSKASNISDARSNLVKIFQGHGNLMTGCGLTSNEVVTKYEKRRGQIEESFSGTNEEKSSDDIEELEPENDVEILDDTENGNANNPKEDNTSFGSETSNDPEDDFDPLHYFGEDEQIFPDDEMNQSKSDEEIDDDDDEYEEVYEEIDEEEEERAEQNDSVNLVRDAVQHGQGGVPEASKIQKDEDKLVKPFEPSNVQEDEDDDIQIECVLEGPGSSGHELTPVDLRPPMITVSPQPMISVSPQPRTPLRGSSSMTAKPSVLSETCDSTRVGGEYRFKNRPENSSSWPRESSQQCRKNEIQTIYTSGNYFAESRYIDLNAPFQAQGRILAAKKRVALVQGIRGSPKRPVGGKTASLGKAVAGFESEKGLDSTAGKNSDAGCSDIGIPGHDSVHTVQRREPKNAREAEVPLDGLAVQAEHNRGGVSSDPGSFETPWIEVANAVDSSQTSPGGLLGSGMPSQLRCIDPECTRTCPNTSDLDLHLEADHGVKSNNDPTSTTEPSVPLSQLFQCQFCYKTFKTKSGLKNHISVHTGFYRFYCEKCRMGFNKRNAYEKDQNRHSGKGVICLRCKKIFLQLK